MPEWISVNDRLPERTESVLVATAEGKIHLTTFFPASRIEGMFPAKFLTKNVLYWMPLPELPEELKGE